MEGDKASTSSGLAAGIALVVAALAAVGLSGTTLTRAVRNYPLPISVILSLVLAASLAITVFNQFSSDSEAKAKTIYKYLNLGATAVIAVAVIVAVFLGASSVHEREQPSVTLAAENGTVGVTSVKVSVAASGLATQDQLVVQVLGLRIFSRLDRISVSLCEQSYTWSKTDGRGVELDTYLAQQGLAKDYATLLAWNRIGPDANGAINLTFTLNLPSQQYAGLCAFSPLPSAPNEAASNSAAYIQFADSTRTTS